MIDGFKYINGKKIRYRNGIADIEVEQDEKTLVKKTEAPKKVVKKKKEKK